MSYFITKSANFTENSISITDHVWQVFNKISWSEQLEAIRTLIIDQKDLILIAKTEFEKSLMFNSVSVLQEDVVLIIMSLCAIENEQVADLLKVTDHARCSSVVLNEDSNTSELWADIQKNCYSHDLYFSCLNL